MKKKKYKLVTYYDLDHKIIGFIDNYDLWLRISINLYASFLIGEITMIDHNRWCNIYATGKIFIICDK